MTTHTLNMDRLRIAMPWAAWLIMVSIVSAGVWQVALAKNGVEQAVEGIERLREDLRDINIEMKLARDSIHGHDIRISTLEEWKRLRQ